MDAYTPPDTSYGSEDEGSVQVDSQGAPTSSQGSIKVEHWISQAIHGSTTSTTSSSSTQSGGSRAAHRLADVMAQTPMGNHSAPPDVTTYTSEHSIQMERPQGSTGSRTAPKYCNAELMETGDGEAGGRSQPQAVTVLRGAGIQAGRRLSGSPLTVELPRSPHEQNLNNTQRTTGTRTRPTASEMSKLG
ncbi:disco-interacting protein 2 homolog C-like isoform X1 [Macaca nemestrina]|uniref:disco-interacting protein 2 homolog C-like isoform X1 n=1 Tax=Macaca nemestrina TaxID=9545 RepID=UPI0039B9A94F